MTTSTHTQRLVAAALSLVLGAAYATVSLLQFRRFVFSSFDQAIFEQVVKSYAKPGAPVVDVKGPGFNILGDHFSPVTALVAPFYRVFPSAQTVLLAQVVLIAVSVYVIATLAMRHLGTPLGAAVGLAYGVSFGVQAAVEVDFHEVAFGAPLLALAGAACVERRFGAVVAWSLPLLLVKEDLGITVAVIGGVLWLAGERRRATWLAVTGLVGALVVVFVVLPAVSANDSYAYTSTLGGERGLLATLFDEPGRKLATVALTVGITGLAALASPWVLVVLPTFAWRFAGDVPFYWGTEWHYSLVLMPVVFVAMIDAMKRRPLLRWAVVPAFVVSGLMLVSSPLATLLDGETYQEVPRAASAKEAIALVPDGASVESDIALLSHLVTDHTVYWWGTVGDAVPDYVLFDTGAGIGSPTDVVAYAQEAHGVPYTVIYDRDGYLLAHQTPRS